MPVALLYLVHCSAKWIGEFVDFLEARCVRKQKGESRKLPRSVAMHTMTGQGKKPKPFLGSIECFQAANEQLRATEV